MKSISALLVLSAFISNAQAAEYKTEFRLANPGVLCQNEDMSRFTGREVLLKTDDIAKELLNAQTADGSTIRTEIRDVITVEGNKRCNTLRKSPKVLSGTRSMYVTHMKSSGACVAYIIEEITVNIGRGNAPLYGKTAYSCRH